MEHGLLDDGRGLPGVEHVTPGGKGGAGAGRQERNVKGAVQVAVGGGGGLVAGGGGGGILAAGHAVDVVVEADDREAQVPAGGVDQVVAADGGAVAVTGEDDDVQLGIGHLDARGKGDGPAMGGVDGVEVQIARRAGGAADAGDDDDVVPVKIGVRVVDQLVQSHRHVPHDDAVAAAGAPDVGQVVDTHILMDHPRKETGVPSLTMRWTSSSI